MTTGGPAGEDLVVIDTMIASAVFSGRPQDLVARYMPLLKGKRLVLSFVTVAELRYGALAAKWGESRTERLEARIRELVVVSADDELTAVCARMRAECKAAGHGLHQKTHEADRWIAATAIRYGIPLVSDDQVFLNAPGLSLLRAPAP